MKCWHPHKKDGRCNFLLKEGFNNLQDFRLYENVILESGEITFGLFFYYPRQS